jgi:PhzF family phenazine biosynthesis protein
MAGEPFVQVDAFTRESFGGNPAAVFLLPSPRDEGWMQRVAREMNQADTAFLVSHGDEFDLRWFTPMVEVELCGHATLASAHVLFGHGYVEGDTVAFDTRQAGRLTVTRDGDLLSLDFPSRPPAAIDFDRDRVADALGGKPAAILAARDLLVVFAKQSDVEALRPHFAKVRALDTFAVIATAPGDRSDFVSRFFAPKAGIDEDPVTGSAHCTLTPYWSRRLGKKKLHALQVSRRGGELFCEDRGERVAIAGRAIEYLRGEIEV